MLFLDTNVFLYAVGRPHPLLELLDEHEAINARDALHAATAKLHGIERIVTADRHFDSLPGLRRIDPSDAVDLPSDEA